MQLFRIEEAGYGESNQLRPRVEIQFSLDALPMRFDCLDAQVQRLRRFTSTHALAYHLQNLQFAVAQSVDGICRPPWSARGKLVNHVVADGLRHVDMAVEHVPQRAEELLARGLFHDVSVGSGGQHALGINGFVV